MSDVTETSADDPQDGVAIVGMAGRFPGARNLTEFWANLRDGVESIVPLSDEELLSAGVAPDVFNRPEYVRAAPRFEGMDLFDAEFFGYSAHEARVMDPQHRLFLETVWEALEHAGTTRRATPAASASMRVRVRVRTSATSSAISTTVSDCAGRTTVLDSSCRSWSAGSRTSWISRVPASRPHGLLDLARRRTHRVPGSAQLRMRYGTVRSGVLQGAPEHGLSPPGGVVPLTRRSCTAVRRRRPRDRLRKRVGVVVLKRLEDALADGDTIHAVIRGSAVNNDGAVKASFTAPSVAGQAQVITEALAAADLDPESIDYVEATGPAH
ncbi:polyketide synthase [Streptomyces sp. FXJ1.4098]|nr:polyketide synthase [Streptomyces sp. FXJ1.4098]